MTEQCDWGSSNGEGWLNCVRDKGHDPYEEPHCTIHESPQWGGLPPPPRGEPSREWFPGWLWESVLEQDRARHWGRRPARRRPQKEELKP